MLDIMSPAENIPKLVEEVAFLVLIIKRTADSYVPV